MVNGQSDFSSKFFGYMVISAMWLTLPGQNRGPYILNPVFTILLTTSRYLPRTSSKSLMITLLLISSAVPIVVVVDYKAHKK